MQMTTPSPDFTEDEPTRPHVAPVPTPPRVTVYREDLLDQVNVIDAALTDDDADAARRALLDLRRLLAGVR